MKNGVNNVIVEFDNGERVTITNNGDYDTTEAIVLQKEQISALQCIKESAMSWIYDATDE